MMEIRIYEKRIKAEDYENFVLGGDIGGTHTNLAMAGVKNGKTVLLFSTHFESQKLHSLIPAIKETLDYSKESFGISADRGCIGVAGAVTGCSSSKLTNLAWGVDAEEIKRETGLLQFFIINDFQAIGYGIESLSSEDLYQVRKGNGSSVYGETRAIIGAGTGLGKAQLVFDGKDYHPIKSEGGHGDFPVHDSVDLQLAEFIKAGRKTPVSYEEVLSGRGIERIYQFLRKSGGDIEYSKEIESSKDKAAVISKYRHLDRLSQETFRLYAGYYGRCSKNYVLDTMAIGGLYIAGGIAPKNKELFATPEFQSEFLNAEKQRPLLKKTPVYIILNYNVSLYGACNAAMKAGRDGMSCFQ